ncbi:MULTISPECIES: acyl-CoA thioesterase [unclassified Tessaracoccus]|uniref:acyl-CoA thioesterase n=1 Tax=unclassified Tessaracoccus TaxID=2635419 RepID=UPI0016008126|nr:MULTISPECIES: acyl-CoA thioesterase [unclassified Tessaracoccus]MBB1512975.1 acyl-CoA thioesterase [Tessaracoccus sp. MC1627]MBB1515932.1 acyl-CoA thioesterase [Tessaracoccus sp. MC1679]
MPGTQRGVTLRFLAEPMDANVRGLMSAGKVLEWIDKAGYAAAVGWAGTYAVTGYVGNIHFTRPIHVGDLVVVQARVVLTGRTSLQVVCTVSSGDPRSSARVLNTQCVLQFVAMEDGKPVPVPPFEPRDEWERGQHDRALEINVARRAIEEEMGGQEYDVETGSCRETLRFLAAPTDVNWGGKVHGGYVMNWIDQAAQVVAERWHAGPVASVFAGGVRFYRPMFIGDLVEVTARLLHTGTTSMHISVHVSSGDPRTRDLRETTHCTIVYCGVDEKGRKRPVPPWQPVLPGDVALETHARAMIDIRRKLLRPVPKELPPDL